MSRRNKKLRRRIKITLKAGHEARHKLIAGRTGSVHHKKTRVMAKADGVLKVLVPAKKLVPELVSVGFAEIEQKKKKFRIRKVIALPENVLEPIVIEEGPDTSIDLAQQCYSLCLRALHILSELAPQADSPEGRLFEHINQGIEGYEKNNRREK